jgi:hypothetical protein
MRSLRVARIRDVHCPHPGQFRRASFSCARGRSSLGRKTGGGAASRGSRGAEAAPLHHVSGPPKAVEFRARNTATGETRRAGWRRRGLSRLQQTLSPRCRDLQIKYPRTSISPRRMLEALADQRAARLRRHLPGTDKALAAGAHPAGSPTFQSHCASPRIDLAARQCRACIRDGRNFLGAVEIC